MFKYAAAHYGIDALAYYGMDIAPDTRMVTNPARNAARKTGQAAEAELAAAERALPQLLNSDQTPKQLNAALPGAHAPDRHAADRRWPHAKAALKPIPAKLPATDLDPDAKRARPHLARRGLQMVLRLLAFNAEPGSPTTSTPTCTTTTNTAPSPATCSTTAATITYTTTSITVTLDRPDTPRIARALAPAHRRTQHTPQHDSPATPDPSPTTSHPHESQHSTQPYFRGTQPRQRHWRC